MGSNSTNVSASSGGILLPGMTILFVALKLTGVIDWSWWWVLAPFWIPLSLGLVVLVLITSVTAIVFNRRSR